MPKRLDALSPVTLQLFKGTKTIIGVMHQRSPHLHRGAAVRLGAVCAIGFGFLTAVLAEPIVLQDSATQAGATADTSRLVTLESEPLPAESVSVWPTAPGAAGTKPEPAKATDRALATPPGAALPDRPSATAAAPAAKLEPNADISIHSTIKESVRPVYEQLVESGAVEALHDLKADLGLNKDQWSEEQKANTPAKGPGQWDAPGAQDPAAPPRTAAQAQLDREMATLMREKLIDQVTPWLIGLVVLYGVGYLVKLLYGYIRWKSAKRNERRIARTQRHTSRRLRSSSRHATSAPLAEPATQESRETA